MLWRCLAYQKLRDNRERIETRGERRRDREGGIALFFERDRTRTRHCPETSSRRFLFAYPLLPPIVIIGPCPLIIKQLII